MIDAFYRKDFLSGKYLDPFNNFQEKEIVFEIRQDGITGTLCRILPGRRRGALKPEVTHYLARSPEDKCPFCPALLEQMTPRFTPEVHPEGKFRRGGAVLFPNAFPHDRFNGVAIFSDRHYVPLTELTPDLMLDGFLVCRDYFSKMKTIHPELKFASINWNYMPPAGGGLIHPHLQTLVAERPTRFAEMLQGKACHYQELTMGNLWGDIVSYEKAKGERYVGSTGEGCYQIDWISSFAPRGMAGEIGFTFNGARCLFDLGEGDFRALTEGLFRVFRFLDSRNLISFNLSLFATLEEDDNLWVQGTILPRYILLPLEASDINYFEKIHNEIICPVLPEDICRDAKEFFTGGPRRPQ
jgi:UDPglucose--hexose-1-phosphate uridylyltransferase